MVVIWIVLALYIMLVIVLIIGFNRARQSRIKQSLQVHKVSVIIPVRNEAHQIEFMLRDLAEQSYPNFEVIVVDDHSADDTARVAVNLGLKQARVITNQGAGKKLAVALGVSLADGDIILTTDADCRVGKNWIEVLAGAFEESHIQMVFGAVRMESKSFFDQLQSLEFASLIGSGAASSALGVLTMCNGANLAYRKRAFLDVGGYAGNEHIPSGDDEFLMRKIERRFPSGVKFMGDQRAIVTTKPQSTLNDFFHQRIRWAGKWRANTSFATILLAFFILASQAATLIALFLFLAQQDLIAGSLLLVKILFEGAFLGLVCKHIKMRINVFAFLVLQIVYPFYVVLVGIASNFFSYRWKGRTEKGLQNLYNLKTNNPT